MQLNYRRELVQVLANASKLISEGEAQPESWSEAATALFILLAQECSYQMTPHEFIGGMEIAKHAILKDHMGT
jgi:hypothetical protein